MSQRDLTLELRGSRIAAPLDLRERVRTIAAAGSAPRNRRTWGPLTLRRAFVVALPIAAAITAGILLTQPHHTTAKTAASQGETLRAQQAAPPSATTRDLGAPAGAVGGAAKLAPLPSATRAQRYGASLALGLPTPERVSQGVQRALRITASLGGYPTSVHATSRKRSASADLTLKVPRTHVQQAITRLSALGTITAEQVDVQDVQGGIDEAGRTIDRLQSQLRKLRAETQNPAVARQITALTARIEGLQRARADAARSTRYATIDLHLATPHRAVTPVRSGHGPLHGLGIAFHWVWVVAVYALALGLPLLVLTALVWLAVRTFRRRREDALLN